MSQPPPGAQLSPDGNYWWDGSQWQPVSQPGSADPASSQQSQDTGQQSQDTGATDAQGRQLSPDGNYYWDGSNWQPVDQSSAQSSSAPASGQSTGTGAQINPEEFPSIGRVLYYGADADAYLQDLGIDTSDLQSDDPPSVA